MNKKKGAATTQSKKVPIDPRIPELQRKVRELTEIVEGYKSNEMSADTRIKELTEMHSKKVKALLHSIDQLKKENTKNKLLQKDNVKSQVIEQYKKDIETQDFIIGVLRKMIGDDDKCDLTIVKALNKGPDRIRSATREELKMENKKLKAMIQSCMEQNEKIKGLAIMGVPNKKDNDRNQDIGDAIELEKQLISVKAELDDLNFKSVKEIEEKNNKICEFMEELTNVKSEIAGKDEMINKLKEMVDKMNEDLKIKAKLESELSMMTYKYNKLNEAMDEKLKEMPDIPIISKDNGVDQEEMEIKNLTLEEMLRKAKNDYEKQKVNFMEELELYKNENERLKTDLSKSNDEVNNLKKEIAKQSAHIATLESKADLNEGNYEEQKRLNEDSYNKLISQVDSLKKDKEEINKKYLRLLVAIEDLESQLQSKVIEIEVYQAKLAEHGKENKLIKGDGLETINEEDEILLLKKKVKELSIKEVELMEELENERDKNRIINERLKMTTILNTQKRGSSQNRTDKDFHPANDFTNRQSDN